MDPQAAAAPQRHAQSRFSLIARPYSRPRPSEDRIAHSTSLAATQTTTQAIVNRACEENVMHATITSDGALFRRAHSRYGEAGGFQPSIAFLSDSMHSDASHAAPISLLALGDLMLCADSARSPEALRQETCLRSLRADLPRSDLVFANLEATLPGTEGVIAKEPRLETHRDHMARALSALGVNVVSLANNHAFDCHASGFREVLHLLRDNHVRYFGAGADEADAAEPLITPIEGLRIGWLGYVAGDTHPSHVASLRGCGIRLLDNRGREP
jgi:hypothetical protein